MTHADAHEPRAVNVQVLGENLGRNFVLACRREADDRLVTGWARCAQSSDQSDLRVQGLGYQVEAFLGWLRAGVPGTRISRILVTPTDREECGDFLVLD